MDNCRKHIYFSGRVQDVGFRYFSVMQARKLGLTGWVRNLTDGRVEMEVEGEERLMMQLVDYLQSQISIRIEDMEAENIPLEYDESFYER